MSGAQPAAAAPAVTTDEVLPAISMCVGHKLQALDAIVVFRAYTDRFRYTNTVEHGPTLAPVAGIVRNM